LAVQRTPSSRRARRSTFQATDTNHAVSGSCPGRGSGRPPKPVNLDGRLLRFDVGTNGLDEQVFKNAPPYR